jgi:hypothetical protein
MEPAPTPKQPHVAVIDGYLAALEQVRRKPIVENPYKRWGKIAVAIAQEGYTESQVYSCVLWVYSEANTDPFWKNALEPIPLENVGKIINKWAGDHPSAPLPGEPFDDPLYDHANDGLSGAEIMLRNAERSARFLRSLRENRT